MKLVENYPLHTHSAMAVGGTARFAAHIHNQEDVLILHQIALREQLPFVVCGEGTNTLFASGVLNVVVGFMKLRGITLLHDDCEHVTVRAAAGELWDTLVDWTVSQNLTGIEALSLIPGTVGAAPIQNIGAYGSEFKDTCTSVTVYDTQTQSVYDMQPHMCMFGYRDSIFKQQPGRFVVLAVTLKLLRTQPTVPEYKDVREYFGTSQPQTVQDIRNAIITIRTRKLPDYKKVPNLGSFFKNPVVTPETHARIQTWYPDVPHTVLQNGNVKLYAGWLIEHVGLSGTEVAGLVVHERNALILTNPKRLPYEAVHQAEQEIITRVQTRFGITLEREPVLIS